MTNFRAKSIFVVRRDAQRFSQVSNVQLLNCSLTPSLWHNAAMNRGYLYALTSYILWGFFPIFWKQLHALPAGEVILHRIIWSWVFLLLIGLFRRRWAWLRQLYRQPRRSLMLAIAAVLLGLNWLTYVWGVNHGFVVQASLGYFISPLLNVLLGVLLLGDNLRRLQWWAVGLAGTGVLYLIIGVGEMPWVALGLASSFSLYGFYKKKMHLDAVSGLTAEMTILILPALILAGLLMSRGQAHFATNTTTMLLLMSGGVVTAVPLLLYAAALQTVPLSVVGVMQYLAPLLQFFVGIIIYREPFSRGRLIGFTIIWVAVALFIFDTLRTHQDRSARARAGA